MKREREEQPEQSKVKKTEYTDNYNGLCIYMQKNPTPCTFEFLKDSNSFIFDESTNKITGFMCIPNTYENTRINSTIVYYYKKIKELYKNIIYSLQITTELGRREFANRMIKSGYSWIFDFISSTYQSKSKYTHVYSLQDVFEGNLTYPKLIRGAGRFSLDAWLILLVWRFMVYDYSKIRSYDLYFKFK